MKNSRAATPSPCATTSPSACCCWTLTTSNRSTTPTAIRPATSSCGPFAERIRLGLRAGDIAGRWGGEEFLVVLPRTDLGGALDVAERIRAATAASSVTVGGRDISVTVSGGCALGPSDSVQALVDLADQCLYQAKDAGRNRIVTAAVSQISNGRSAHERH